MPLEDSQKENNKMALKNWKKDKRSSIHWTKQNGTKLFILEKKVRRARDNKILNIYFVRLFTTKNGWTDLNKRAILKKLQALKFARLYMKKH